MKVDAVLIEVDVNKTQDLIDAVKMLRADMGWSLKISLGNQYDIEY